MGTLLLCERMWVTNMSFSEFFQQNIILFAGAGGLLVFLLVTEWQLRAGGNFSQTPATFTRTINDGAALIDLRRADDFRAGHIAGARNIVFEDLDSHLAALAKDKPVALYCYVGSSSAKAAAQMKKQGFAQVTHLGGGMRAWEAENLPLSKA